MGALGLDLAKRRALFFGAVLGVAGLIACAFLNARYVPGFAIGFSLGAINALWLQRIIRRALAMRPEKVLRYVALGYQLRFAFTALVMAALIIKLRINPWPMVAGLTAALASTLAAFITAARLETR